jgi:actin-like ATPase involved in cell morphogenesis
MDVKLDNQELNNKDEQKQDDVEKSETRIKRKQKNDENQRMPGVGLDCGTMFAVAATYTNKETSFKTQRNAFFNIENNSFSKNMLSKLNASYVENIDKQNLYIIGDEALQVATFFNKECRRPFSKGVISTRETEALNIIKIILHNLVKDPIQENEKLFFSVPADPIDVEFNNIYHENVLKSFLKSFGYDAEPMNEAFAIVWAELEDEKYSGMALSFGAGSVNVALSLYGISEKQQQFCIARSGDYIDFNAATAIGEKTSKITMIKESGIDLLNPKGREENAIKIYYENLIKYTCDTIEKRFKTMEDVPNFGEPISIIISGGTSKAGNFDKLFDQEIHTKNLPFKIKAIRKAKDPLNAVAKGCLLNALNHE